MKKYVRCAWAFSLCTTLFIMSAVIISSAYVGGLGVHYKDGEYILIQGAVTKTIDQTIGKLFLGIRLVCLLGLIASITLSVLVYMSEGTINLAEVMRDHGKVWKVAPVVGFGCVALSVVGELVFSLVRMIGRHL